MKKASFAERVYRVVAKIPKGSVLTYAEVARRAGSPRAYRAVGTLMRKNTRMDIVPCHRVIRSDGAAGYYSGRGGTKEKIKKLNGEGYYVTR